MGVYDYIIKNNIWSVVGKLPIREDLKIQPLMYIYDSNTDTYSLYDNNTGEITPCKKDKARGLERASVWGEKHIEDRIRDYYNNVPCVWLNEHYKLFPETNRNRIESTEHLKRHNGNYRNKTEGELIDTE